MATSDSPLSITASAGLSVAMQAPLQVPGAPTFTVSVTSNSATAVVSNGNGADSYQVSLNDVDWTNGLTIGALTASTSGTLYCRGVNGAGPGPSSSQAFTTNAAASGLTDPARLFTVTKSFEGTVGENTKNNANGMDDWGANTIFSNEEVYSGTTSGKMQVFTSDSDGGTFNWGGIISFANSLFEGDEFWIRFRLFQPVGFIPYTNGGGGHIKFTRIKTYTSGGANGGLIDVYYDFDGAATTYKYIKEFDPNTWTYFADSATYPHIYGEWVTFNQYYKLHSDPAQSIVRFWRNNDLVLDQNLKNLTNSTDYATDFYIFTYWNGTVPQNQHAYIDDVVITSDINSTVTDSASGHKWVGV